MFKQCKNILSNTPVKCSLVAYRDKIGASDQVIDINSSMSKMRILIIAGEYVERHSKYDTFHLLELA